MHSNQEPLPSVRPPAIASRTHFLRSHILTVLWLAVYRARPLLLTHTSLICDSPWGTWSVRDGVETATAADVRPEELTTERHRW